MIVGHGEQLRAPRAVAALHNGVTRIRRTALNKDTALLVRLQSDTAGVHEQLTAARANNSRDVSMSARDDRLRDGTQTLLDLLWSGSANQRPLNGVQKELTVPPVGVIGRPGEISFKRSLVFCRMPWAANSA